MIVVIGDFIRDVDHFCTKVKERDGYGCYRVERTEESSGGAGAVANMLYGLGVSNKLITDYDAESVKTRYIDEAARKVLYRIDNDRKSYGVNTLLPPAVSTGLVLVADYGKGMIDQTYWNNIVGAYQGKEIIVDPHPSRPLSFYEGATAFKYSEEYDKAQVSGCLGQSRKRVAIGLPNVVTWGRHGIGLCLPENLKSPFYGFRHSRYDHPDYRVVDVCGAGDAVLAMLGACRLQGLSWQNSCQYAVEYAAKVCLVWGARHPGELWNRPQPLGSEDRRLDQIAG